MAKTPYYTSQDIIDSVKRNFSVPISQVTYSNNDILRFADEEMTIAQVPQVLSYHSEYFTTYKVVPITSNVSRYPIPERAIGMKIRDIFWMDTGGNIYEMTQTNEEDRAFYQRNLGTNTPIHKYFFEGNDIVLTPSVVNSPAGSLFISFYIRPNQLVKNDRAATIKNFAQTVTVTNSLISVYDVLNIGTTSTAFDVGGIVPFTAVNTNGGSITAISASGSVTNITSTNHHLSSNQTVTISGSNSVPSINGTWTVTVIDANTFSIATPIGTAGTTGSFTCANQFVIGATDTLTATNLAAAINAVLPTNIDSATSSSNIVTINFENIYTTISSTNTTGFIVPSTTLMINFSTLPSTYTDDETNITENLFQNKSYIDFLQTKPGHKIYLYDVQIPANGISGTTITFPITSLQVPSGTIYGQNTSTGIQMMLAPLVPNDYMCLDNECIIPYLPPDLHNGLAHRTGTRMLAALGDQQGAQAGQAKIQEINQSTGTIMKNRDDAHVLKVVNRKSPLWFGKISTRGRGN